MVVFSGFYESNDPPPSGDARIIVPTHCDGLSKRPAKVGTCSIIIVLIVSLAAAGAMQSK
jgi:hypothetical protein